MSDNAQIIRNFIEAWWRLDPAELASYFCEDGCYYNMPSGPVAGRENVQQFIAGFTANWTATNWDIIHLLAEGDVVLSERLDRTKFAAGGVNLPCLGVFEMSAGKIKEWRDYFDLNTFMSAVPKA